MLSNEVIPVQFDKPEKPEPWPSLSSTTDRAGNQIITAAVSLLGKSLIVPWTDSCFPFVWLGQDDKIVDSKLGVILT